MSFGKVEDWLRSLGLICYAQAFYDNGYEDIEICQKIGEADLDEIGVKNVKDRIDILASIIRLQKAPVYFELEPELHEDFAQERVALDPLFLKTSIKEELEQRNIDLTVPPYFNLDGTLGNLRPLAEVLGADLNTITEDVLDALDQIRRRQLPADTYSQLMDDPQEYLNVEVGLRPRRATSLSRYDSRITKSTSNLHETGIPANSKGPIVEHFKGQQKKQVVAKKSSGLGKFFHSFRRSKSPIMAEEPPRKLSTGNLNAGDINIPQDELKKIMTAVKNKELTQDAALYEVTRRTTARVKSKSFDGELIRLLHDSSPDSSPKEKEDQHERKKRDKVKKKKAAKNKKSGHTSIFYSDGAVDEEVGSDTQHALLANIRSSPLPLSSEKKHVMTTVTDGDEGSPELISLNRDKPGLKNRLKRSFRRNGKSPVHGDDSDVAFRSTETLNSSTGSAHSSSQDSIISAELQELGLDQPVSFYPSKQIKKPPPIPVRKDIPPTAGQDTQQVKLATENQHKIVWQASKSAPVPPPRNCSGSKVDSLNNPRTQGERSRSVTFNDSILINDTNKGLPPSSERKISSASLSKLPPVCISEAKDTEIETNDVFRREPPVPPPRRVSGENNMSLNQDDKKGSHPVAPPRLKRSQNRLSSGICAGSTDGHGNTDLLTTVLPSSSVDGKSSVSVKPLVCPEIRDNCNEAELIDNHKRDKNQNSLRTESENDVLDNRNIPKDTMDSGKNSPMIGKPMLKPKPMIPPRPLSTVDLSGVGSSSAVRAGKPPLPFKTGIGNDIQKNKAQDISASDDLNDNIMTTAPQAPPLPPAPPLMPGRAIPFKNLLRKKLRKESVEISKWPYTTQEGKWNVPIALLERYSEELEKPLEEVASTMDGIRTEILEKRGVVGVPVDVSDLPKENQRVMTGQIVDDWLIVKGLPMFIEDFKDAGLTSFSNIQSFPEDQFKNIGVYDQRHLERLLLEIKKL